MSVPMNGEQCQACGYYDGQVDWLTEPTGPAMRFPRTVRSVDWSSGAPVPPLPGAAGADGYILNVTAPFCANCSAEGGERKTYQAVVGGYLAAKFSPAIMPGPPRAHMGAQAVPVGLSGVSGFPNATGWTNVQEGVVVDMQQEHWGNFWWQINSTATTNNKTSIRFGPGGWCAAPVFRVLYWQVFSCAPNRCAPSVGAVRVYRPRARRR